MKKHSFLSFLLAITLIFSLMLPTASAMSTLSPESLSSASSIVSSMKIDSDAALLVDMNTDVILYSNNAYESICPASITKVMTALLVLEHVKAEEFKLSDTVKAQKDCWTNLDNTSSNQNIQPGEKMTVEDLLYCLLVASANESANILAEKCSGSIEAFVDEMNTRAKELGCNNTHFVNPHGMPDDDHYTTCYDLYLITKEALNYSEFRKIVKTDEYYVEKTNKSARRHFFNTNALLSNLKYRGYYYEDCIGIKTGTTDKGGYNLLAAAEQSDQTLISVVIGCHSKANKDGTINYKHFSESARLLKWGFDSFSTTTIVDANQPYAQVAVTLSTDADSVTVKPEYALTAELPKDITADSFTFTPKIRSSVEAPITKGQTLGSLQISLNGQEIDNIPLIADEDVEVSYLLKNKAMFAELFSHWYVKALLAVVVVLILMLILRLTVFRPTRRYGNRYNRRRQGGYHGSRRRRRRR